MNTRNLLISAGIGGAAMGILSGVPLVSLANCILCLWVWAGGILAVYVYVRMENTTLTSGQGAIIGAIAGVVGAIIASILGLVFGAASLAALSAMNSTGMGDVTSGLATQGIGSAVWFLIEIVIFPGFGALAGLIGVELFGKAKQPQPPAM
jgi:hypothetical protein